MNDVVLKVENLSKIYRLGEIGTGTISHDLNRWWASIRGKEDPFSTIGSTNDRTEKSQKGEYVKVLDDINFEVKRGEVLGVIGKNGAGKSTLLKVISQITSPTSGSIKAKGRIASLLEVGTGMHPEMTGKENVYLNGTILGMTKREIDVKFDEIMEFAGCAKYSDTPVKRYSSGMKVRLGFAVAAFLEPEILIVDEVLAVGDAEFQKKAIGKMQDITSGGGRTVLFVSHNMGSIGQLCSNALVLENGSVILNENVNKAIDHYLNSKNTLNRGSYLNTSVNNNGFTQIQFYNEEDNLASSFKFESYLMIKIDYSLRSEIKGVVCSFSVEKNGQNVFSSFELLERLNNPFIIKLPSKILLPGEYDIQFTIHKPNVEVIDKSPSLKFTIEDTGSRFHIFGNLAKFGGAYIEPEWS